LPNVKPKLCITLPSQWLLPLHSQSAGDGSLL
jgi:hypothetical protein